MPYAIIAGALFYGAWTDHRTRTIPNFVPITILLCGLWTPIPWAAKIFGMAVLWIALAAAFKITKSRSGGGDIKVYCALAFALGITPLTIILFYTFLLVKLTAKIRKRINNKGQKVPMCCYIAPAYILYLVTAAICNNWLYRMLIV